MKKSWNNLLAKYINPVASHRIVTSFGTTIKLGPSHPAAPGEDNPCSRTVNFPRRYTHGASLSALTGGSHEDLDVAALLAVSEP